MSILRTGIDKRAEGEMMAQVDEADIAQERGASEREHRAKLDRIWAEKNARITKNLAAKDAALPKKPAPIICRDHNAELDEWGWTADGRWYTDAEAFRMAETCDNPEIARRINAELRKYV
jgi:seryl-tRNA(Sec) selenium transferase